MSAAGPTLKQVLRALAGPRTEGCSPSSSNHTATKSAPEFSLVRILLSSLTHHHPRGGLQLQVFEFFDLFYYCSKDSRLLTRQSKAVQWILSQTVQCHLIRTHTDLQNVVANRVLGPVLLSGPVDVLRRFRRRPRSRLLRAGGPQAPEEVHPGPEEGLQAGGQAACHQV